MLRPVLPRPPSLNTALVSARDDIHAGSSPDAIAATTVAPTVTASTTPSTSKEIHEGGGFSRFRIVAESQSIER